MGFVAGLDWFGCVEGADFFECVDAGVEALAVFGEGFNTLLESVDFLAGFFELAVAVGEFVGGGVFAVVLVGGHLLSHAWRKVGVVTEHGGYGQVAQVVAWWWVKCQSRRWAMFTAGVSARVIAESLCLAFELGFLAPRFVCFGVEAKP